jgi:hypothetical protein
MRDDHYYPHQNLMTNGYESEAAEKPDILLKLSLKWFLSVTAINALMVMVFVFFGGSGLALLLAWIAMVTIPLNIGLFVVLLVAIVRQFANRK